MALPIKETPILQGEDARAFESRMNEKRTETKEQKQERLYHYNTIKAANEKYGIKGLW